MMKSSQRAAATTLAVGYVLGRRRKLRTATLMAVAMAAGRTGVGAMVAKRGAKLLVSSKALDKVPPQVGELVDVVRDDLVAAGKAAASAAVTNRIDSLTDSLHDRAEQLRNPGAAVAEGAEAASGAARKGAKGGAGAARGAAGGATRRVRGRGADDEAATREDDDAAGYADEDTYPEDSYSADDDRAGEDREDDEPDQRPARRASGAARRQPPGPGGPKGSPRRASAQRTRR
jgi:hypothetical protein